MAANSQHIAEFYIEEVVLALGVSAAFAANLETDRLVRIGTTRCHDHLELSAIKIGSVVGDGVRETERRAHIDPRFGLVACVGKFCFGVSRDEAKVLIVGGLNDELACDCAEVSAVIGVEEASVNAKLRRGVCRERNNDADCKSE